jgi:hypothetical protein
MPSVRRPHRRFLLLLAYLPFFFAVTYACAARPVAAFAFGDDGTLRNVEVPELFTRSIARRGVTELTPVPAGTSHWRTAARPNGAALVLVQLTWGNRVELLAISFDRSGVASRACRRPANRAYDARFDWGSPGANQYIDNAWRELAADFHHLTADTADTVVDLRVAEWQQDGDSAGGEAMGGDAMANEYTEQVAAGFEALALAAVSARRQTGARLAADDNASLTVRVQKRAVYFDVQLAGNSGHDVRREYVPREDCWPYMRLLLQHHLAWGERVCDYACFDSGWRAATLVAASRTRLCVLGGGVLTGLDTTTSGPAWSLPATAATAVAGVPVATTKVGARRVALANGAESKYHGKPGAAHVVGGSRLFKVAGDKLNALSAESGESQWTQAFGTVLSETLVMADDALVAFVDDGRMVRLSPASGEVLAEQTIGRRVRGEAGVVAGRLWVSAFNGELLTLSPETGSIAFTVDTSDVMLAPPTPLGDDMLVATRGRELLRVAAADGAVRARFSLPTRMHAVLVPTPQRAILIDRAGGIWTWAAADAQPRHHLSLGQRPAGVPMLTHAAPRFAPPAAEGEEAEDRLTLPPEPRDLLAVGTADGFVILIATPFAER